MVLVGGVLLQVVFCGGRRERAERKMRESVCVLYV